MVSTSTVTGDEEFMEDLITLLPLNSGDSDCEIVSVSENKTRPEIKKKQHSNEQEKPKLQTVSSYGKGDFYLPARFFDITRNKSLLERCRAVSINIVDCGKFPEFYRKKCGIRKPRPKSKQTYTLQHLLQDMSYQQKLKQNKYEKLSSEYKKESKVVGQVSLTPSKLPDVDFKKNIGLVGLKIERKLVGLVFDEKSKEDKKHKSKQHKHTADNPKNKSLESKEFEKDKEKIKDISIENKKPSKEQTKPSELMIDKGSKILFEKATSLKCSLNLNPILSTTVQQKLLEITSKSVQQSVISSKETVHVLSSNTPSYNNKTIIGQRVKNIDAITTKVSIGDTVSGKSANAAAEPKNLSDKNRIPSSQNATIANELGISVAVETEIPKNTLPEKLDLKTEVIPNEVSGPEAQIKSEPEIKQELKDEALATNKMLEDPISVSHPNPEVIPVSLSSPLRSFRKSIENTLVTGKPIEDLRQIVGQSIPVQTTPASEQHIENWQLHRYDEAGLNQNCANNCLPSFNSTFPQTQPNVSNLQGTNQNIGADSKKQKFGDLKIQTVSQINNSVVSPVVSTPCEPVSNLLLAHDHFHLNDQLARSAVRGSETTIPGPKSPLLNSGRAKKIVSVRNTHYINDQNSHVTVGPYTAPPPYVYGYQPPPPHSAHWTENSRLANKMPFLMQQLNHRQRPIHPHPYWDAPLPNQEYFYRSVSANQNQVYDEYRYNQWNRPPPPRYLVEPRMKYVPPYQKQKVRPQTYPLPNSKPDKRVVSTKAGSGNSAINQFSKSPSWSSPPPLCPQSAQGVNDNNRVLNTPLPTCPTPLASSLPIFSTPPPPLSVPQPDHEVHAAEILYPNTTFSQESSTSHAIYTESSNHSNLANHENQQTVERCITQIPTTEMTQTPTNFTPEVTILPDMPLLDSFETDVLELDNTASISLPSQPKARQNLELKLNPTAEPMKPNNRSNNVPSSIQQANNNTPEKSNPNAAPIKQNNTTNNVLSSEPKARHSTPIKSDPKSAPNNQNDTANKVSTCELQVANNTPAKSKPTAALSKPDETANNMLSSQRQAKDMTPTKSKPTAAVSKPNDTEINQISSEKQAKNYTPVKLKSIAGANNSNDASNNVLSSQQQAKYNTPKNSYPTSAPKHFGVFNNVPKKRPYIPSDTKMSSFEGIATTVCERSEPAILEKNINKGYSPPILPIPTVQKYLDSLAEQNNSNNGSLTPVKQSGYRNNVVKRTTQDITPRKIIAPICVIENSTKKRKPDQTAQSATKARKISIDEYKKRHDSKSIDLMDESKDHKNNEMLPTKDKSNKKKFNNNNENRGVDLQDLGYDSDPPSKF